MKIQAHLQHAVVLWLLALAGVVGAADEAGPPRVRLALCASGDAKGEGLAALVEAALSQRPKVVLLDRGHVREVLKEQAIALQNGVSAEQAFKAGSVLGCDAFAELRYRPSADGRDVVSVTAFDARTSARLWDRGLVVTGAVDTLAQAAAAQLAAAARKFAVGQTNGLRTVSLGSLRGMDLSAAVRHVPGTLGALLEREFLAFGNVAVLERQRLERVNQEAGFTQDTRDRLLASSLILDLDIYTGRTQSEVRVKACFRDAAGKPQAETEWQGAGTALVAGAAALAQWSAGVLRAAPTVVASSDLLAEAQRFAHEAELRSQRSQPAESAAAAHAALALGEAALARTPDCAETQFVISRLLRRQIEITEDPWEALGLLERDLALCSQWTLKVGRTNLDYRDGRRVISDFTYLLYTVLMKLKALPGEPTFADSRVRALRAATGQWVKKASATDRRLSHGAGVWALSVEEILQFEAALKWSAPREYSFQAFFGIAPSLYPLERMTAAEHRLLCAYYSGFRPIQARLAAVLVATLFPASFDNPEALIRKELQSCLAPDARWDGRDWQALTTLTQSLRHASPSSGRFPLDTLLVPVVDALGKSIEAAHLTAPCLVDYLNDVAPGLIHAAPGAHPGANATQAHAPVELAGRQRLWFSSYEWDEIVASEMVGGQLYWLALARNPEKYGVFRLAQEGTDCECMGEMTASGQSLFPHIRVRGGKVAQHALVPGAAGVYVPTAEGVLYFQQGAPARFVVPASALPVANATACCEIGQTLYLACAGEQEGYFLRFTLDAGRLDVLACSGRKEQRSLLDNCMPYSIESMHYHAPTRRLLLTVIYPDTWTPWLKAYNVEAGTLGEVCEGHYFAKQLRALDNDRYLVRVHSNSYNGPHGPCLIGYGIWDARQFTGKPIAQIETTMACVLGSIHRDARKTAAPRPDFNAREIPLDPRFASLGLQPATPSESVPRLLAASTASLLFLDDRHLAVSDGRAWQMVPRSDCAEPVIPLALLGDQAPLALYQHGSNVLAVTRQGVWRGQLPR